MVLFNTNKTKKKIGSSDWWHIIVRYAHWFSKTRLASQFSLHIKEKNNNVISFFVLFFFVSFIELLKQRILKKEQRKRVL